MFDDLDETQDEPDTEPSSSEDSGEKPEKENDNSLSAGSSSRGTQTTVDEVLIEQTLKDSPGIEGQNSDDSPEASEGSSSDVAGSEDSPVAPNETAEDSAQIPVEVTRADAFRAESARAADYEARIRKIQEEPLRTPTPALPPLPGTKYVNPWS